MQRAKEDILKQDFFPPRQARFARFTQSLAQMRLYLPYLIAGIVFILLLWHIFDLLVGNKSLVVLLELHEQEILLENSIKFYQRQNAFLQKEIFELIGG